MYSHLSWAVSFGLLDGRLDSLDIIDIKLILLIIIIIVVVELEVALVVLSTLVSIVDLGRLGKLTLSLESSSLIGVVLHDDISLVVLKVSQRKQNDIGLVDPHLLSELSSDVSQSLDTIEALGLKTAVSEHLDDLSVLLALLLEDKLSLATLRLVLSSSSVLSALELVRWAWGIFRAAFSRAQNAAWHPVLLAQSSVSYSPFPCS